MPFAPTDIADLVLWLDASDLTATLANNDPVDTWVDKSSNARNLTASGAARPTFHTGVFNSLPAVTFDGTQTYLTCAAVGANASSGWTTFLVLQADSVTGERFIFENGTAGVGGSGYVFWQKDAARSLSNMGVNDMFGANMSTGVPELWSGGRPAGSGGSALRLVLNSAVHCYLATSFNDAAGNVYIGAQDGTSRFFQGSVAEIVSYNRALTSDEWDSVHTYLGTRYAITLDTTVNAMGLAAPSAMVQAADFSDVSLGFCFRTTKTGRTVQKVRLWLPPNTELDKTGASLPWAIYGQNPSAGGAVAPALATGSIASLTHSAWNEDTLGTPFALTQDTDYYLTFYWAGGGYPNSAGANSFGATITLGGGLYLGGDGTDSSAAGTDTLIRNNSFHYATGIAPPDGSFNQQWYGGDVEISAGGVTQGATGALALTDTLAGAGVGVRNATGARTVTDALAGAAVATHAATGARALVDALTGAAVATRAAAGSLALMATLHGAATAGNIRATSTPTTTGRYATSTVAAKASSLDIVT
jgi:hypothetical protein